MAESDRPTPPRTDAVPGSYALRVADDELTAWQYRTTAAEPDGDWQHVETLAREDGPRLALEYATLAPPDGDGYWVYADDYECITCDPDGDGEVSVL